MPRPPDLAPWRIRAVREVYRARDWFRVVCQVVELPDGRVVDDYFQIDARPYVEVCAYDRERGLLGLWRYKHGPRRVCLGVPAGYLEPGETALAAGRRELAEECALHADHWELLGSFTADGNRGCGEAHVVLAHGCRTLASAPVSDDLEEHRQEWLQPGRWRALIAAGEVPTLGAVSAVLLALARIGDPSTG